MKKESQFWRKIFDKVDKMSDMEELMNYGDNEDELVQGDRVRHFTINKVNKISFICVITLTSHVVML